MPGTLQTQFDNQIQETPRAPRGDAVRSAAGSDFTAIAVAEINPEELVSCVGSPERPLNEPAAVVVKRGRSALVVKANLSIAGVNTAIAYKRCGSRLWRRRIVRGLRTSGALRNFRLGRRLLQLGIATPLPLLAISPRWHNWLAPSFLATQWIDGGSPLDAFVRTANSWAPAKQRATLREAARQLGKLVGTLHKQGFSHRDLKSGNLLVREHNGRIEAFLVDLDGAAHPRLRVRMIRLKNLARLHVATHQLAGVTPSLRCRFVRSYVATLGGAMDWKTVWRQLPKASRIPPSCPTV
jgi:tRNA A-37 threonylcarbamoyl transferase component Bud32